VFSAVTLIHLSWATPEGRSLFSNLNLSFGACRTGLVGRNGVGKTTLLKLIAGELRPRSGQISVTGSLGVLTQVVQVRPGETIAHLFDVADALTLLRCAEEGIASAEELAEVDWSLEARILSALARVGLDARPETYLHALSGGGRTRAILAAALFAEPDFLLLDEPTNHLDREGRAAVIQFLARWRGGAIVVSHDRELLETMDAIVELTSLGAHTYSGNWSDYRARKATQLEAAKQDLAHAEKRVADVKRSAQATAERKARKDSVGQRKSAKGGTPRIMLGMLKERSEGTSGANARMAERRRTEAVEAASAARQRIEVLQPFSVDLPSTHLPAATTVLEIFGLSAGYEPGRAILHDLSLTLTGPERIAVAGPNGCGKTTLLKVIAGTLQPWAGTVRTPVSYAILDPQASILDASLSIRDNFRRMNPEADENSCRASLARFMFRADAALQIVSTLSGGQILRAALACVLGKATPPPLLILDEPTNHLDIDSIEAVEAGLRAYDGALLVISHDESFLQAIGTTTRISLSRG
jgi:ATPase subunit of ABC transporter with duplicated ATPase domains